MSPSLFIVITLTASKPHTYEVAAAGIMRLRKPVNGMLARRRAYGDADALDGAVVVALIGSSALGCGVATEKRCDRDAQDTEQHASAPTSRRVRTM